MPRFRAFAFDGAKGDEVDIWVRSVAGSGDAMVWLTDSMFQNLAVNDDASAGTLDSHVALRLPRSGAYYVVLRNYYAGDASFDVSMTKVSAPCDPDEQVCPVPTLPSDLLTAANVTVGNSQALRAFYETAARAERDRASCGSWARGTRIRSEAGRSSRSSSARIPKIR